MPILYTNKFLVAVLLAEFPQLSENLLHFEECEQLWYLHPWATEIRHFGEIVPSEPLHIWHIPERRQFEHPPDRSSMH